MRIRTKITLGFVLISLMVFAVGIFGFRSSRRITAQFEDVDKRLRAAVESSTNLSGTVKTAESHLMLYLALHDEKDRDGFFRTCGALRNQVGVLEKNLVSPEARNVLQGVRSGVDELLPIGEAIIRLHDEEAGAVGDTHIGLQKEIVLRFHDTAASIRGGGVMMAGLETEFLNRQGLISAATELGSYAERAEGHLMLYLLFHDEVDREKFFQRCDSLGEQIDYIARVADGAEISGTVNRIKAEAEGLHQAGVEILDACDHDFEGNSRFLFEEHSGLVRELYQRSSVLRDDGARLAGYFTGLVYKKKDEAVTAADEIRRNTALVVVGGFLLALAMGILISRNVTRPLLKLKEAASEIGEGNFDVDLDIRSGDEISELALGFKAMARNLRDTTVSLQYVDGILASMLEMVVVVSDNGTIITVNKSACTSLGYAREDLLGQPFSILLGHEGAREALSPEGLGVSEREYRTRDGGTIPVLFSSVPLGGTRGTLCVAQDITERKMMVEGLKESLRNKEVLISEIHHRVKNNLSVIHSLLSLQSNRIEDERISGYFQEAQNRVLSLALIHDRLYGSSDFSNIDVSEYIRSLATQVFEAYNVDNPSVRLVVDVPYLMIDMDSIVVVGLIINELVTNALKYAFPDKRSGVVTVGLKQDADYNIMLSVSDDGVGIPEGLDVYETGSLGFQIVTSLVEQLGGELQVDRNSGTSVVVQFSDK